MSNPKKPAFSAPRQMTWGPHGKSITTKDFNNCPGLLRIDSEGIPTLDSVSKLFQSIEEGKCPGDRKNIPHVTYRFAGPLIAKQLAVHGRKELRERWSRYEKLATEFALEELDTAGRQFLDGFISYDLFAKGSNHYFEIKDGDLEDILSNATHRMPQVVSDTEKENILLHFPNDLTPFFEKPKNRRETRIQTDRQNKLRKLVSKNLQDIFKDYEVTLGDTSDAELQQAGSFITVKFTNDSQTDDSILGYTATKDLSKDFPDEGYKNLQHDEKPDVYLHSMVSRLKSQEVIIKTTEKEVDVKLERWARLIAYITTHELLHAFGIPHLDHPQGRTPLLMDEKIEFSLLSYWKGANDIAKIKNVELLRKLLTPKQKAYLDFILKKKAPENKTGYLDFRRKEETMGCEFDEINGRCYFGAGLRGPEGSYFDLFKDENGQEVIGYGAVDPQDLFQPPGAKEFSPVQPTTPYAEDREGRILSLGHFFGRPIRTLHPNYYHTYFTPHYSMADLLVITPRELRGIEVALLSNDLFNFLINDNIPHWEDPITDDQPQLAGILERLKKIVAGELKPPRVYKEDAKQNEHEIQNSRRALEMIHFYWRLGSDEAGRILDSPQFRQLLQQHHIERKGRFEQIVKKLEEQNKHKQVEFEGSKETTRKEQGDTACHVEGLYFKRDEAEKCAEELSQKMGQPHTVANEYQNIGDAPKPLFLTTYYKVIQGPANRK